MTKILIIDDDPQICTMAKVFLGQSGYAVATAENGVEGLKTAAEFQPDLIICDLDMPGLDGQGVVTALRQDEKLSETPVIFLSACTDRGQIRRTMNLGADDFISKPAFPPELLEAIKARLLRRQKQQQRLDKQIEQAVDVFAGIIHDLKKSGPETRWLFDESMESADSKTKILRRVRQSLAAGGAAENIADSEVKSDSLLVKSQNRRQFLKLSEVKALVAYGEYAHIHWGKDQHVLYRKPMKQWEAELPPEQFVRVHRQAIINLAFLDFVEKKDGGKVFVHLKDFKEAIAVSQRETGSFNRRLKQFQTPQAI